MSIERLTSEMTRLNKLPLLDLLADLERNGGGMMSVAYLDAQGQPEAAMAMMSGDHSALYLHELHQAHQVAELLKAAEALRDDLLIRGHIEADGRREVNVSATQWSLFNRAIDNLHLLMREAS